MHCWQPESVAVVAACGAIRMCVAPLGIGMGVVGVRVWPVPAPAAAVCIFA